MDSSKPMNILLVEDNFLECEAFKNYMYARDDVKLIGIANSSAEALQYVKTHVPEGIILDIELNNGSGSGLEFLEELNKLNIGIKPLIIITTNIASESVYTYAHKNGADLIFHKLKNDYSPELVVKNLLILRKSMCDIKSVNYNESAKNIETINERNKRISDRINRELDLIGIGAHLVGRKYIVDAILYILDENNLDSAFIHLAKKYKTGNSTIGRAIQTAIEHAWKKSSTEDLKNYYTATVNYNTGTPTPTEFVYYYVDKIKKSM